MPGTIKKTDKLDELAIAANEQMRGHFQVGDFSKVGMLPRVKLVAEKVANPWATKLFWWQADVMYYQ